MFTNKEIVDKIRSLAWSNGTSLTKLEEQLGWANGRIGKWEGAKKRPSLDLLMKVADTLNVKVYELTGENEKNPASESETGIEKEFLSILRDLQPDTQTKLLELARLYLAAQRKSEEKT